MIDEYTQAIQELKHTIFTILLNGNNQWKTKKQLLDECKRANQSAELVNIDEAIKSSLFYSNPNDEFKIISQQELHLASEIQNACRFKLKTPDIKNKEQLEDYLREKKCLYGINQALFESCYPNIQNDIFELVSKGKLKIKIKDKKASYIYVDSIFENYQKERNFKNNDKLKQIINDYKKQNQSNVQQNNIKSNKNEKQENQKRSTTVQNDWIPELKAELQKK